MLRDAGIERRLLEGDATSGPGVCVATMHRVKGLDFTHVVLCASPPVTHSPSSRDKSLLYVAATRCRSTLSALAVSCDPDIRFHAPTPGTTNVATR